MGKTPVKLRRMNMDLLYLLIVLWLGCLVLVRLGILILK